MYSVKTLVQGSALTTSAAVYYTAPAGTSTRITQISVCNNDSVNRTFSLYLVADASAPASIDNIIKSKTLTPAETWVPYPMLGAVISEGGTIQGVADTGAVVILKVSGVEITN